MSAFQIFTQPSQQALDTAANVLSGATLTFTLTGTSTPTNAYSDSTLTTPVANPLSANAAGVFVPIFLDPLVSYRIVLKTSAGAVLQTWDPANENLISYFTQTVVGRLLYPPTAIEISVLGASLTGLVTGYEWGDVRRFGATCDGVTDDTTAVNRAATVARAAYGTSTGQNFISFKGPGPCLVSSSLDFSLIDVYGYGEWKHIQATSAQFDVMTSTGSMKLVGLRVDGGWNGVTAGLSGDILSLTAVSPAHPYGVNVHNCQFVNAKKRCVYIERGGYTSFTGYNIFLSAGLHVVECWGDPLDQCTTISTAGTNQWSTAPNGYGIKVTEVVSCKFRDVISEATKGFQLNGSGNRALTFDGCYQEFNVGTNFIEDNSSAGIGLVIRSCWGSGLFVPYLTNWQNVYLQGNFLGESAVPLASRVVTALGSQTTTATTGGVDVTAATASLGSGTWLIFGSLQTIDSAAAVLVRAAARLTTNVADSGLANSTSTFVEGADQGNAPGATDDARMNCFMIYQNTTTSAVNMYLRANINISGGTIAYRGNITAVKLQ